ncbi:hypothetical protein RRG08_032395 [Elysia crispata]|uniref:Uncharacterized protein n=1 Tax=Elysia crispata TaxID=231223 RepID=A0AAE0Y0H4_9GAST|nr:hypothetical protein RRG08_032395 [Elysia crispata]
MPENQPPASVSVLDHKPQQVSADHGRRNGGSTADKAYNGTNFKFYYHTPVEFYSSGRVDKDPADTAKAGAGVLDKSGQVRMMSSSGVRIRTPEIEGVGVVRTRYPIMPVHGKGAPVWKEFNAMKGMTMHMNRYASLFEERPGQMSSNGCATDLQGLLHFQMSLTHMDPPGEHNHDFYINSEELDELKRGVHTMVTSSMDMGHEHELELVYRVCRKKLTSTSYTKHWGSWAQTGQMIGWGRGSAQNASRFSAMARDGDGRGRDLVDMRERLCRMLYDLRVIVEVNVVDDVMDVHVMHLGMLHGPLPTMSRLDADECTHESRRFLGLRKAAMGRLGMAFFTSI